MSRHFTSTVFGVPALTLAMGVIATSCGGSASESPWPVEPESPVLGPQGEEGKAAAVAASDGGTDAAPNVEP